MFLDLCFSYRNLSPKISQLRLPIPNGFLSYDTFCLSLFADVSWNERSLFYLSFNYFICLVFFALTRIAKDGVVLSSYCNWGTCKTKQKVSMMYKGWPTSLIFIMSNFAKSICTIEDLNQSLPFPLLPQLECITHIWPSPFSFRLRKMKGVISYKILQETMISKLKGSHWSELLEDY